jgi:chitinase
MFTIDKSKKHGPLARRAALGAALVVAAAAAACSSSDSNLISPTDSAADARFSYRRTPSAPQRAAAAAGNASATVTWAAPAQQGGGKINSYTVVTSPGNKSTRVDGSTLTANITGLTNGRAYTFTVYAANFFGSGPGAATNSVTPATTATPPDTTTTPPDTTTTPPAKKAPTAPTTVTAAAGNAQAAVTWGAPADTGTAKVTSYTVTSAPGGKTAMVTAPTMSATITGLTNGTAYTFTVTAANSVGSSPASAASNSVTPAAPAQTQKAPAAPTAVTASAGNAQASVSWTAPTDTGTAKITQYTVTSSPAGMTMSSATTSLTFTGLTNGTAYTFTVKATNSVGSSAASSASSPVTPAAPVQASGKWISGYWVGYNRGLQNENQIDMSQLTHIMVGRADVVNGNQISTGFFQGSASQGATVAKTITARAHAAGKKAIMMIGGSDAVASLETATSSSNRAGFITNLLSAMDAMSFDGIDVDWEPISTADQPSMLALVQGLRSARPNIIITAPLSWVYSDANSWYSTLAPYVDQMNFMSYEMDANYDGWVSWHFSAVQGETANHPSSINKSLVAFTGVGVPAAKLGAGVGSYGHCWKGITAPNQSLASASWQGGDNKLTYASIMASYYNASLYQWDATAQAGYLSSSTAFGSGSSGTCTYLTYESPQAVTAKGQFVKAKGMGGIMFWTIDQQYIAGASGVAQNPLINAAYIGLNQ